MLVITLGEQNGHYHRKYFSIGSFGFTRQPDRGSRRRARRDRVRAPRRSLGRPAGEVSTALMAPYGFIPQTYCDDVHERLTLYKRLANCGTPEELAAHMAVNVAAPSSALRLRARSSEKSIRSSDFGGAAPKYG